MLLLIQIHISLLLICHISEDIASLTDHQTFSLQKGLAHIKVELTNRNVSTLHYMVRFFVIYTKVLDSTQMLISAKVL